MRTVRAKFECTKNDGSDVELQPVVAGSPEENKAFWKATPSGKLEMWVSNPDAADFFEVGEEYYLDFTKAS